MNVVIRADASTEIGSGHVMRCLTLANRLKEEGGKVTFVCRNLPGNMSGYLAERGVEVWVLPPPHNSDIVAIKEKRNSAVRTEYRGWLGVTQMQDAAETQEILKQRHCRPDWLVVDHYAIDAGWERALRPFTERIMIIDDLADREHDCDLLLDQNLQESGRYEGLVSKGCQTLIGPRYALLRPQFANIRQGMRPRTGSVSRLLLFFGGADAGGETLKALAAIERLERADLAVDVVLGAATPHRESIEAACRGKPNVKIYIQIDDMAARMANVDLFVGAGGTSSWERCCLGLPALVLATAGNQVPQCRTLARAGAQLYLGEARRTTAEDLARHIDEVLGLPELLGHMAEQGQALVDGRGVMRVAHYLEAVRIKLRRAQTGDCTSIFTWRNHPDTRRHALNPVEIEWETHERWFTAVLEDPNRELLIGEQDGHPIGVLRYDIEKERGVVSIYLVPGRAGQGWGLRLLLAGERWLKDMRPDVRLCEAEVASNNPASSAIFEAAGFTPKRWSLRKEVHDNH